MQVILIPRFRHIHAPKLKYKGLLINSRLVYNISLKPNGIKLLGFNF